MLATFVAAFTTFAELFLVILSLRAVFLVSFSYKNYRRKFPTNKDFKPYVSIVVPCYNEQETLENCLKGLINSTYQGQSEILIVNDGSTDKTLEIAKKLAKANPKQDISVLDKPNGGKSSALNLGTSKAKGEIVICIDADSIFLPDTIAQLVAPFNDPKVDAVTGNVRISNTNNLLTKSQSIEYLTGLNLDKRAFSELSCVQVCSGCISAFKKSSLIKVGGYSSDTLVEDMDLTITMLKAGCKVVYNANALAYTEAPENFRDLYKQRYRWGRGKWEVLRKHKEIIFNSKAGTIGIIGIPYYLFGIIINIMTAIIMISLFAIAILSGTVLYYILSLLIFTIPIIAIFLYVLYLDKNKDSKTLPFYLLIQMLYYPYFIMYCDIQSWIGYKMGKKAGWDKLKRIGANSLPVKK